MTMHVLEKGSSAVTTESLAHYQTPHRAKVQRILSLDHGPHKVLETMTHYTQIVCSRKYNDCDQVHCFVIQHK